MSDKVIATVPVFLPGNDRDWLEIDGQMIIDEEGVMTVHLSKENAERLVDYARQGILFQVSFDYRMPAARMEAIKNEIKKRTAEDPPWLLN